MGRGGPWLLGPLSRVCRTACLPRASQPSRCRAARLLEPAASAAWCHTLWRMPRRAALSRLRNRRWSGRSASASGYAAQQRGRHGGTDRAPRIVHRPTQCLLRGACPTAPACGHTRSRTKTHPTRAFSSVSSIACVQVQPISSLRSHPRSARSPEPFTNHRKLSDQHRAAHGPARLASHTSMPCAARTARAAGEASTEQAQLLRRPSFVLGGGRPGFGRRAEPRRRMWRDGDSANGEAAARRRRGGGEAATARGRGGADAAARRRLGCSEAARSVNLSTRHTARRRCDGDR